MPRFGAPTREGDKGPVAPIGISHEPYGRMEEEASVLRLLALEEG